MVARMVRCTWEAFIDAQVRLSHDRPGQQEADQHYSDLLHGLSFL